MHAPIGVVPGLCTVASAYTVSGIGIIFYLTSEPAEKITPLMLASLLTMLAALFLTGCVPWLISRPVKNENQINLQPARKSLIAGMLLFLTALFLLIIDDATKENTKATPSATQQNSQQEIK